MPSPCCETCKDTCQEGSKCGTDCKCGPDCKCSSEASERAKCNCKADGACVCPEGSCTCK